MATDYIGQIQQQKQIQAQGNNPDEGVFSRALDPTGTGKTGAFNIPVVGGLLRGLVPGAETVAQAVAPSSFYKPGNTIISPNAAKEILSPDSSFGDVTKFGAGTGLQAGLAADSVVSAPSLIKNVVTALPNIPKYLSSNLSGKAIQASHEAATVAGATDSAPDLATEFKQAVEDKLGGPGGIAGDKDLANSYGKVLKVITGSNNTPQLMAKIDPSNISGELTPTDLVNLRQNLVTRFGYSPTDEGTLDQKVANIARGVISQRAKDITPGLADADKAYAWNMNARKALPAIKRGLGLGAGAGAIAEVTNLLRGATNSSSDSSQ